MLTMTELAGFAGTPAGPPATVVNTASASSTSDLTSYSFAAQSLGTAAAGRRIVVGVTTADNSANSISSVSIGGVAATPVVAAQNGTSCLAGLFILQVDAGTTATIDVVFANATFRCGIGIWAVYDLQSSAATDTGSSAADPMTDTLDIQAGGVAIGVATAFTIASVVWTNLTENYDAVIESGVGHSGACAAFATAQTGLSITCDANAATTSAELVMAAFR